MARHNGADAEFHSHGDENDQHGHGQHDLRHHDGHIEHEVDELLAPELELFQSDAAQHADHHADGRRQHRNCERVGQGFPKVVIPKGEELSIPLGGKSLPGVVALGVVEGEGHHHQHGDIENGVDDHRIEITEKFPAALTAQPPVGRSCHIRAPPYLRSSQSGNR